MGGSPSPIYLYHQHPLYHKALKQKGMIKTVQLVPVFSTNQKLRPKYRILTPNSSALPQNCADIHQHQINLYCSKFTSNHCIGSTKSSMTIEKATEGCRNHNKQYAPIRIRLGRW